MMSDQEPQWDEDEDEGWWIEVLWLWLLALAILELGVLGLLYLWLGITGLMLGLGVLGLLYLWSGKIRLGVLATLWSVGVGVLKGGQQLGRVIWLLGERLLGTGEVIWLLGERLLETGQRLGGMVWPLKLELVLKKQNKTALLSKLDYLKYIFPEECVAELGALNTRLIADGRPKWLIHLIMIGCFLDLIWAVHVQIKLENLSLPKKVGDREIKK